MSEPWAINAGKASTAIGTATIESDDNLFTLADHGLGDGDTVTVDTLTGGGSALTADAVYFVRDATTNDFALSLSLHGPQVEFATDGGADVYSWSPQYNAAQLRRLNAGLMFGGTSDAFGVRQGVRPGHVPLSVSGTTWTVEDLTGAVYPALSSDDGGYPVQHQSESGSLDPADGSNDRIDALDLQIQDDDTDASGFRRARAVYVAGTPAASPSAPAVTSNALRLGTILVPSGGSPSPSIDTLAQWTVASGGVLPVRDDDELPTTGLYDGMTAWDLELGMMLVRHDGDWVPASSEVELDHVTLSGTVSTGTTLTIPSRLRGLFRSYRLEIDSGIGDGPGLLAVTINGDTGTNYRWGYQRVNPGNGNTAEDDANNDNFGVVGANNLFAPAVMVVTLRPRTKGQTGAIGWAGYGWANAGTSNSTLVSAGGRWAGTTADFATIQVRTDDTGHTWSSNSSATLWGLR